ncbi:hypothetical protein L1987_28759 [Smallanthus sonchifolius]|uniref:Uncharacterized protein n=1 Tax=Smallanthus sonchifolius TaxID=185202 RepID=A0ACB9HZJ7_9ASTR|nr:hypothetical protein L1987_28759 [Smallanthus sonchifolius]
MYVFFVLNLWSRIISSNASYSSTNSSFDCSFLLLWAVDINMVLDTTMGIPTTLLHRLAILTVDIRHTFVLRLVVIPRQPIPGHLLLVIQGMEVIDTVWERFLPEAQRRWRLRMELTICLIMAMGHMVMDTMGITIIMASLNTISSSVQSLANVGSIEGCLESTKCGNDLLFLTPTKPPSAFHTQPPFSLSRVSLASISSSPTIYLNFLYSSSTYEVSSSDLFRRFQFQFCLIIPLYHTCISVSSIGDSSFHLRICVFNRNDALNDAFVPPSIEPFLEDLELGDRMRLKSKKISKSIYFFLTR